MLLNLAIVASLAAILGFGSAMDVNALTKSVNEELSPKSFGSKTDVCGDKLCSEIDTKSDVNSNAEVIDIYPLSGDYYKILIKITNTPKTVFEGMIFVTSDMDTRGLSIPFINENSHDYVSTTIRATDPQSIEMVYYFSNAIVDIDDSSPQAKLVDVSNISTEDNIYRVIFDVTTKEFSAKKIKVLVSSDVDSINYSVGGLFEDNTHTNQAILRAINPESISVQVVDFSINR